MARDAPGHVPRLAATGATRRTEQARLPADIPPASRDGGRDGDPRGARPDRRPAHPLVPSRLNVLSQGGSVAFASWHRGREARPRDEPADPGGTGRAGAAARQRRAAAVPAQHPLPGVAPRGGGAAGGQAAGPPGRGAQDAAPADPHRRAAGSRGVRRGGPGGNVRPVGPRRRAAAGVCAPAAPAGAGSGLMEDAHRAPLWTGRHGQGDGLLAAAAVFSCTGY